MAEGSFATIEELAVEYNPMGSLSALDKPVEEYFVSPILEEKGFEDDIVLGIPAVARVLKQLGPSVVPSVYMRVIELQEELDSIPKNKRVAVLSDLLERFGKDNFELNEEEKKVVMACLRNPLKTLKELRALYELSEKKGFDVLERAEITPRTSPMATLYSIQWLKEKGLPYHRFVIPLMFYTNLNWYGRANAPLAVRLMAFEFEDPKVIEEFKSKPRKLFLEKVEEHVNRFNNFYKVLFLKEENLGVLFEEIRKKRKAKNPSP